MAFISFNVDHFVRLTFRINVENQFRSIATLFRFLSYWHFRPMIFQTGKYFDPMAMHSLQNNKKKILCLQEDKNQRRSCENRYESRSHKSSKNNKRGALSKGISVSSPEKVIFPCIARPLVFFRTLSGGKTELRETNWTEVSLFFYGWQRLLVWLKDGSTKRWNFFPVKVGIDCIFRFKSFQFSQKLK